MATELFELPFLRLTFFVDIPPGSVQRNHPHLANRSSRRSISIAVDCHPQHERLLSRDLFSVRKVLMCFECNYTIPVCAIINFRCGWALFCLGQHYWRNLFWIQRWIYLPVPFSTKVTVNVDNGTEYFTGVIDGARQQLAQDKTDYPESFHNNEMKKKKEQGESVYWGTCDPEEHSTCTGLWGVHGSCTDLGTMYDVHIGQPYPSQQLFLSQQKWPQGEICLWRGCTPWKEEIQNLLRVKPTPNSNNVVTVSPHSSWQDMVYELS